MVERMPVPKNRYAFFRARLAAPMAKGGAPLVL